MNHRPTTRSSIASSFRSPGEGQNMTLLIFGGLVVLCSIFFVLGMVVGRMQGGTPNAELADVPEGSEEAQRGLADDLTFYESVGQENPPGLAAPPEPPGEVPPSAEGDVPDAAATLIFLQVAALGNTDQADRLLDQLLDDGFPAFLVRPEPSDDVPLHRVRIGPYATEEAASLARRALEDRGFNPIVPR